MSAEEAGKAVGVSYRHAKSWMAAAATNIAPEDYERFCEAAEKAFQGVVWECRPRGWMTAKAMRKHKRELIRFAMNANEVPWWVRLLGSLAPWPWNVVIAAVLWAVERMVEGA